MKSCSIDMIYFSIYLQAPPNQALAAGYEQQRTPFVNGYSSPSYNQVLSDTNLYIKNLPPEYSDKDLAALVEG